MNNPKFCVGEEVAVRGMLTSSFDIYRTEVIRSKYVESGTMVDIDGNDAPSGWRYQTAHQTDMARWWREESLHKLPKDNGNSFESLMRRIKQEVVDSNHG